MFAGAPRILVADDSVLVARVIERHFQSLAWEVVCASDGMEALTFGLTEPFDLALLDHLMPTVLGAEVLQTWRESGIDMPVIMLSAVDDEKMTIKCLELGANDFLQKPVNTRELEARARVHLLRRGVTIPR